MNKQKLLGFLLMLISGGTYSIATIIVRNINTTTNITPLTISITRFLVAAPLFWLLFPRNGFRVKTTRKRWLFMVLGLVFSVANFSAGLALNRVSSSIYVIVLSINSVFTVLYSLLKGHSIPRFTAIGLPIALCGLVLAVFPFAGAVKIDLIGIAISLINGLGISVYYIVSSKLFSDEESRMPGSSWIFLGAMMVSLVVMPFAGFRLPENSREWLLLATYGTVGTIIPIITANYAINLLGAAQASMTNIFQPIATVFLSVMILKDVLNEIQIIGALFVLVSVVLLQVSKKRPRIINADPVKDPTSDSD